MHEKMLELEKLIEFAKKQGLRELKMGEYHFVFSEYELAKKVLSEHENSQPTQEEPKAITDESNNPRVQNMKADSEDSEERDLLFWSSGV